MVSLSEIRRSNSELKTQSPGLVAVFVGGTAGIGANTLKHLVISTNSPKVYIVGRSQTAAAPQLDELKTLNPHATFTFIEAQASLLKDVDRVCNEIKSIEKKIDLLFLTVGALSLNGRQGEF
jgi:NADP-dependent 3-hydroxy acid dehydrogenase YdfG